MEPRRSHAAKGASAMQHGLYFRRDTGEITTVRDDDHTPPGAGWAFVSDAADVGLVGARALLLDRGLVDAAGAARVYWLMPTPARAADGGADGTAER
jgi:hypothetical protein